MANRLKRCVHLGFLVFVPALGLAAVLYAPGTAAAQEGTVTCWAESCEGNVCVRVKIACPTVIVPILE